MDVTGVKQGVAGVLNERLAKNGYADADVKFEEDFDGEEIIRVTVHLSELVADDDELYDSVGLIEKSWRRPVMTDSCSSVRTTLAMTISTEEGEDAPRGAHSS